MLAMPACFLFLIATLATPQDVVRSFYAQLATSARCFRLEAFTPSEAVINGDHATIEVDAVVAKTSRTTNREWTEFQSARFELDRAPQGEWHIAKWRQREDALADEIVAAKSDAERAQLLDRNPRLYTPTLSRALSARALNATNRKDFDAARSLLRLASSIAADFNDAAGKSLAIGVESIVLRRQNVADMPLSLQRAKESLALAEESRDADVIAKALLRLGRAEQFRDSITNKERFAAVIAMRSDLEDPSTVSLAASQLGYYYDAHGDHRGSLQTAVLAEDIARETGDATALLTAENSLANVYLILNDYELAVAHFEKAIAMSRALHYGDTTVADLQKLAICQHHLGHPEAFLRTSAEALKVADEVKNFDGMCEILDERARYWIEQHDYARAEADLQESMRRGKELKQWRLGAIATATLGELRLAQHRYREALEISQQAAAQLSETELDVQFDVAVVEARAQRGLGMRDEAHRTLEAALEQTEYERSMAGGTERQQQTFFAGRLAPYLELVDMLVQEQKFDQALAVAERAKGRTLLDVLRSGRMTAEERTSDAERAHEQALIEHVETANKAHADAETLRVLRNELDSYRAELAAKYPQLSMQRMSSAALSKQQMLALLPDRNTAFIEYVVTDETLYEFIVRRSGIAVRTVPISRARLASRADAYVRALTHRDLNYRDAGRKLYELLVPPQLRGAAVIGIVPDGPLWQLPFESLIDPKGRFLTETSATFYAPSLAVYQQMRASRSNAVRHESTFIAFANPPVPQKESAKLRGEELGPLPDAQREVEQVARLFPEHSEVYAGADARKERVLAEAPRSDVIHFATHGILDDQNPMYSHLVLANGDLLETWEMMDLRLHSSLAVLSACETGRGAVHPGEGLVGMSWALFVAGCPSTVVTQWKIPSASSADLIVDFYRHWVDQPDDPFAKAKALRAARLGLIRTRDRKHPLYWSAFVLVGSAR